MSDDTKSRVYAHLDDKGRILQIEGEYTLANITDPDAWTLIEEGEGSRYDRAQVEYFPEGYITEDGIPMYRWDGENVIQRTEAEIEADMDALLKEQRRAEQERINNATETVLLGMVAEQEERICLLEMGVSANDL